MELLGTHNARVVELAQDWIGTPYKHQASLKHVGCDCIGLIVGIWKELYGSVPKGFKMPPYTPSWAEETGRALMVEIGQLYLNQIEIRDAQPGDVLMWKVLHHGPTKHAGIYSKAGHMIHAYSGHDILESPFLSNVGSELTYAFRYPDEPAMKAIPWQQ